MSLGNGHKPGRFVTHSHTRSKYLRKNPYEPGCVVTILHRFPVVGVVTSATNALNGPSPALEHALLPRNVVLPWVIP